MVPKGWEILSIGDLGDVITGSTPKTSDLSLYGGDIPFVGPADLGRGKPITSAIKTLSDEGFQATRKIRKGATLFTCIGSTIGKIGFSGTALATNQQINAVVPNKLHDDNFIYHALKYRASHIAKLAGTQAVPIINKSTFSSQPILVSPLPEQKKIAQILSTWDQAITATERLLENSQQRKKGLMQKLLTGKRRLPGFDGEWKELRLKELLSEEKTRNKDRSIGRVLSVTNHSGFVLPENQFSKRVASDDVSNYRVVRKGQYGYNPSRLNVGSFARLDVFDEGLLSPMYVVFSVDETRLHNDYFLNWMKSNEAKQRIKGSTQGSVRDSVGFDALCSFPFRIPPLDEQKNISAVLVTADKEIQVIQIRRDQLKQEKKALMQQLLTGKRRVQVEAP